MSGFWVFLEMAVQFVSALCLAFIYFKFIFFEVCFEWRPNLVTFFFDHPSSDVEKAWFY